MTSVNSVASRSLRVEALDESNRAALIAFLSSRQETPTGDAFIGWRYTDCAAMEAVLAMAGDECVATMFAMRRTYITPDGVRDVLEPFGWHASEDWRAQAPGLRLVKQYMKRSLPLVAVAGTDMAAGLLRRLKWTELASTERYVLPLSGRFLVKRGWNATVAHAFDLIGRRLYAPSAPAAGDLVLEPASRPSPAVTELTDGQRRFSIMRRPDAAFTDWLGRAPAAVGCYLTFHVRLGERLVGWVNARVFTHGGLRYGELLEVFVDEHFRDRYPAVVRHACATLGAFAVDALIATTTCPYVRDALKRSRFRLDDRRPVMTWWGDESVPQGTPLVDGTIADHAFHPVASAQDAAWLEASTTRT